MPDHALPKQWDLFLKEFSDRLVAPSQGIPSTRCLSRNTLASIFSAIKKEKQLPSTFPSGLKILELLTSMGLATEIPTEKKESSAPSKEFYLIGLSASHDKTTDPFEMLQAHKPDGVICYFSAISYYEMSTQFPSHHHIATLTKSPKPSNPQSPHQVIDSKHEDTQPEASKKIGTLSFSYQGVPFYTTKRNSNTIPGIKTRILNPRTTIKITSKEQTLLDTLSYPIHCGGAEVVFEAWENYIDSIDEEALLDLLNSIKSASLNRRLGALLDFIGYQPKAELNRFLENTKKEAETSADQITIPLLKGHAFQRINPSWNIFIP
ncbi:Transcriptional regulator, AbiEi antitoxin, Type IV TA system [Malonomonas rubra DSM 5091]|uniref:Transcriptional regulator, AbiEi antitoxin, Type IV TA system n=1 Tax=Malonomonas rubra DSM 5091 TaxID=1122189 RepID=A0A1M6KY53_MALRU|nr:type IV toxin-antitoxin system AbiEi family antitoxin [Malonomonas rubra]SHJ63816.1 Transcriptional regulator, AbiEi antitoxin, Type IV TA system [Malonomonas rubra DSM 5091]